MARHMTMTDAREAALNHIKLKEPAAGCEFVLIDRETIETSFGWVFFYQSKRHLETGNISDALAGNAPLVITKIDGRVHETGTALPLERYLADFASYRPSDR